MSAPLSQFWRDLVAAHWNRRVARISSAELGLHVTAGELLAAFIEAGAAAPEAIYFNREVDVTLAGAPTYSRHVEAPPTAEELPSPADRSLSAYASRVTSLLGGRRFCLRLVNEAPLLAARVDVALGGLYEALGHRPVINLVAFVGNYDFTPVGVHTDDDPIIHAVVDGIKRGRFWTPSAWEREPRDPRRPEHYLGDAESHELRAGEAVYWSAGMYHVFECAGLAAGLSVGMRQPT